VALFWHASWPGAVARPWLKKGRVWAVEGANGIGRPLTQRLLASGEQVLDVPAKLAARARVFDTGQGRKTDAADAHAIVMVALRDKGLREVRTDPDLAVLRMLCDRRDELSRARNQALNRLHRLFLDLIPGGAPVKKSTSHYQALLATVRPRDPAGKTRRRMAAEELEDLHRVDAKLKAMKAELKTGVLATGSRLMDIHGIGPAGAARILADVGDVSRFPDRNHFASWTGTAPIDASSGQHIRHRLSRAGNRRLNHVLYIAGIVQLRHDTPGRAYYRRKRAAGKPRWKPCAACDGASPTPSTGSWPPTPATRKTRAREGTPGRLSNPARPACPRTPALRISHFPDPHTRRYRHPAQRHSPWPPQAPHHGGAPEVSTCSAHRTNDVDTNQRRRTLNSPGAMPLTTPFIEGSQKRMSGPHRLSDDAGMFAPLIVAGLGLEGTCG
jgi:transposase